MLHSHFRWKQAGECNWEPETETGTCYCVVVLNSIMSSKVLFVCTTSKQGKFYLERSAVMLKYAD